MSPQDHSFIYIMTNKNRTVLYIGVTSNLVKRVSEHKLHLQKGSFTDRYNLEYCIYIEEYMTIKEAIAREKELKGFTRKKKEELINRVNPNWNTLL